LVGKSYEAGDLTGAVTKVDWVNPHSWIYVDAAHTVAGRLVQTQDGGRLFPGSPNNNNPKQ
jgi:Family of unknown function (DUF6152)